MPLIVVTGPPTAGKTTWVREHAGPRDVIVDYDLIAQAFSGPGRAPHDHAAAVRSVALEARQAAIARAVRHAGQVDVYIVHSSISVSSMRLYKRHRAHIVTLDPGEAIVLARCEAERPAWMLDVAKRWYSTREKRFAAGGTLPPTPQSSDSIPAILSPCGYLLPDEQPPIPHAPA